eukprot:739148_1
MMSTLITLFSLYLSTMNGYYISLDTFFWNQAESLCVQHCNSHLSSIHSEQDYQQLIHAIWTVTNDSVLSVSDQRDTWIGLHRDSSSDLWTYVDGTPFDFASPAANGTYPWSSEYRDSSGGVKLQNADEDYLWDDKKYTSSSRQISCNHCDGVLTKYTVIGESDTSYTYTEAAGMECPYRFGTELASIHSQRDLLEAQTLCNVFNQQLGTSSAVHGCFLGLQYDSDLATYVFDDGTSFDFASDYSDLSIWRKPPSNTQTNQCVDLDDDAAYLLNVQTCYSNRYAICHMPSEVCYINKWSAIHGTGWSFKRYPCEIANDYNVNSMMMISNTRWDNHGVSLLFDYMFSITTHNDGATVGVLWHLDTSCAMYYYIGVSVTDERAFIALVRNDNIRFIHTQALTFTPVNGVYYLLSVVISNSNTFTVSLNDNVLLSNVMGSDELVVTNTSTGYIGIKNTLSSVVAKSLYISGQRIIENGNNASKWFNDCTTDGPTKDPTSTTSTKIPTNVPSITNTTLHPTIRPITKDPTDHPSARFITDGPSYNPSKQALNETPILIETSEARATQNNDEYLLISVVILCAVAVCACGCCIFIFCMKRKRTRKRAETDPQILEMTHLSTEKDANTVNAEAQAIREWLNDVGLPQYYTNLVENGYDSFRFIKEMDDKSLLKEIGVTSLGHQTVLWARIKQLKMAEVKSTDQYDAEPGAVLNALNRQSTYTWDANGELPTSPRTLDGVVGEGIPAKAGDTEDQKLIKKQDSEELYVSYAEEETLGGDPNNVTNEGIDE